MKIQIVAPELVVLETAGETEETDPRTLILEALEKKGLEPWNSIEIEDYTYRNSGLIFAKPVKVYIPEILLRLAD